MPPAIDSFYWFCLNRYRKHGVLQRDDRAFALEYCVGKNTVTGWIKFLEVNGWMVPRGPRTRSQKTGMFESVAYDVIEHDAWVLTHPGTCTYINDPVPMNGTGKAHKSARKTEAALRASKVAADKAAAKRAERPSPDERDRSSPDQRISPVPLNGTYVVKASRDDESGVGKTTHDTEDLAEKNGSALQRADVFSQHLMVKKYDNAPGATCNPDVDDPPSKKKPEEVLVTAARALTVDYGAVGIDLAMAICAACINYTGEWPVCMSYYSKAARHSYSEYCDMANIIEYGTQGAIYDFMLEDAADRLRRATKNIGDDAGDVIAKLEKMRHNAEFAAIGET